LATVPHAPRRPAFAEEFPRTTELDALVDAFERGDFRFVRAEAPALEANATDERVKRAARSLVDRTRPDPLATLLLALTAAFVLLLSVWWVLHGHPPQTVSPPARSTPGFP
jgi:hypothetical protein